MKTSDEAYTIMIFRGATTNPLRLRLRKSTLRRSLITASVLVVVQLGIMAHYVVQTSQVSELNTLRKEIVERRGQTKTFSTTIDGMKQRMLVMQELNRKLQTMFGLEPDNVDGIEVNGRGGEEFPYENSDYSEPGQSLDSPKQESRASLKPANSQASLVANIEQGLVWLDRQALKEQQILDDLAETAGERVGRLAATPSIWPVKGHITSKFGPRISPFTTRPSTSSIARRLNRSSRPPL